MTHGARVTHITAVDWMEEAARHQVRGVGLQLAQRSDQVFSAVLADITTQPAASSIAAGIDTWTYALDNLGGERVAAASVFQDIAQSELGLIYVKGDTTQGETLTYENRQSRMATTTNSVSFNDDMLGIEVPRTLETIYNRVETVIASRTIDAAATTVLFSLPVPQAASIAVGETVTLWGDYRDPAGKATWLYSSPLQQVDSITFEANASATFLTAALAREISARIGIDESVTGVTATAGGGATRGWYINSVEFDVGLGRLGPQITCTWGLAPADTAVYWQLDAVGASELDVSTRLGYI